MNIPHRTSHNVLHSQSDSSAILASSLSALSTANAPLSATHRTPLRLPQTELHRERIEFATTNRRRYTIYGFTMGIGIVMLLMLCLLMLDITPRVRYAEQRTIPVQLLQLGALDDAAKGNHGNLQREGAAVHGQESPEPLADALSRTASKASPQQQLSASANTTATPTNTPASSVVSKQTGSSQTVREFLNNAFPKPADVEVAPHSPATTAGKAVKQELNSGGSASSGGERSRMLADAGGFGMNEGGDGSGLGRFGAGTGRGAGYGLEWGGGGNRIVLHKELPKYPSGVNTSAQIKIRFTVLQDGSVGSAVPMQKGEPLLERAALEALRRWQFNPTHDDKEMVGFITFTFRVQ
jgi:TonB family protein